MNISLILSALANVGPFTDVLWFEPYTYRQSVLMDLNRSLAGLCHFQPPTPPSTQYFIYGDKSLPLAGAGVPLPPPSAAFDEFNCLVKNDTAIDLYRPYYRQIAAKRSAAFEAVYRTLDKYQWAGSNRLVVAVLDRPPGWQGDVANGIKEWNEPLLRNGFGSLPFGHWTWEDVNGRRYLKLHNKLARGQTAVSSLLEHIGPRKWTTQIERFTPDKCCSCTDFPSLEEVEQMLRRLQASVLVLTTPTLGYGEFEGSVELAKIPKDVLLASSDRVSEVLHDTFCDPLEEAATLRTASIVGASIGVTVGLISLATWKATRRHFHEGRRRRVTIVDYDADEGQEEEPGEPVSSHRDGRERIQRINFDMFI